MRISLLFSDPKWSLMSCCSNDSNRPQHTSPNRSVVFARWCQVVSWADANLRSPKLDYLWFNYLHGSTMWPTCRPHHCNVLNVKIDTAVHIFVRMWQVPAVEMLLRHGADAKAKTYDDLTILGMIASTLHTAPQHSYTWPFVLLFLCGPRIVRIGLFCPVSKPYIIKGKQICVIFSRQCKNNDNHFMTVLCWGLSAGYQPRPQVVDRGTTARYGGQLRYI